MSNSRIVYTLDQDLINVKNTIRKLEIDINLALSAMTGYTCDMTSTTTDIITSPINNSAIKVAWLPAILEFKLSDSNLSTYQISTTKTFDALAANMSILSNSLLCTVTNPGVYYVKCISAGKTTGTTYMYTVQVSQLSEIEFIDDITIVKSELYLDSAGQHVALDVVRSKVANSSNNHIDSITIEVYETPTSINTMYSATIPWVSGSYPKFYIDPSIKVFFVKAYVTGLVNGTISNSKETIRSFNIFS